MSAKPARARLSAVLPTWVWLLALGFAVGVLIAVR